MNFWRFNADDYKVGDPLYVAGRWVGDSEVQCYSVTRVTPKGQIVAVYKTNDYRDEIKVMPSGSIVGEQRWSRMRVVSAEDAASIIRGEREGRAWRHIVSLANEFIKLARYEVKDDALAKFDELAIAIEARSDETRSGSAEGESASPQGCAQKQSRNPA